MPPPPSTPGSTRPAAVVNQEIRELWADPRVRLTPEGRDRLEQLYTEWTAAERAEIVEAA